MSLPSLGLDSLAECSVFLPVPFCAGFLCFAEGTLFSANESLDVNCYPWQLITADTVLVGTWLLIGGRIRGSMFLQGKKMQISKQNYSAI